MNAYCDREKEPDPSFLSSQEKEEQFLKKVYDTITSSLSSVTPVIHFNVSGQSIPENMPAKNRMQKSVDEEINEEDFSAAMDFIDSL